MTSLPIENPRLLNAQKICWDLLAPSLQARFNAIQALIDLNSQMILKNQTDIANNWTNTLRNTDDIKNLKKYIDESINKIEADLLKYIHLPPGTSSGIGYAYNNGTYGELLKLDKKYQRIIPCPDFRNVGYIFRPGDTIEKITKAIPMQKSLYDPMSGIWYVANQSNYQAAYSIADDPNNVGKNYLLLLMTRTYIFEEITQFLYFFYSPAKFVRVM
jgi:hypothetical protein